MADFETQQIDVFSPEQKELFAGLMNYLRGGMFPGGTYTPRSPRMVNNAFSSFPEGNPWRGASQTGVIPSMQPPAYRTGLDWLRRRAFSQVPTNIYDAVRNSGLRVPVMGIGPGSARITVAPNGQSVVRKG